MTRALALPAAALLVVACAGPARTPPGAMPANGAGWERLVAAEDARIASPEDSAVVQRALESDDVFLRAAAVRALGRTERSGFARMIAPFMSDPADVVRAAAAHALADVSRDSATAMDSRALLLDALRASGGLDAATAAIAESLGRLPADADAARAAAARLVPLLESGDAVRPGALRGLYFLARRRAGAETVAAAASEGLRSIARSGRSPRERGLAIMTLAASGAVDEPTLRTALSDGDAQVRREAAAAVRSLGDTSVVGRLLGPALADPHPSVRLAALGAYAGGLARTADRGCGALTASVRDASVHVAQAAIQLVGGRCRSPAAEALLDSIAGTTGTGEHTWHRGAQATLALAVMNAGRARSHIEQLARHPSPFARTHAAQAARAAGVVTQLYRLAGDVSDNVRTAAVTGLAVTVGHEADSVYLRQLASVESELLMAAAAALEGSTHPDAVPQLLAALDRVSALRRETSRDARVAILERIAELGNASHAERVRRYATDFDGRVVVGAADIVERWTGTRPPERVQPLPRLPPPTHDNAVRTARSTFVLEMHDGSEIAIRLLPFDAPTNAARFARLARAGYYDGLTIHRVVPNFVVQGGSPGANEYSGDGPYTRDEVGVPNWRGTVGLSTRGRDTGDAQLYINLVDNVRLDHEYTVFGIVTSGMDVVDELREGAGIRRVREETH
ncbi:MAG TPA: peptidylprolyl isomerase [Longimicrobiales bacterium]